MARITFYKHSIFVPRINERYSVTECGVLLVNQGYLTYRTKNGQSHQLNAGEFTIYHSDKFKQIESHQIDGDFSAYLFIFEPSLLRQFCTQIRPDLMQAADTDFCSSMPSCQFDDQNSDAKDILTLLIKMLESETSIESTQEAMVHALLSEMTSLKPDFLPLLQSACNQSDAEKVIGFIEINIENDVTLENTAHFLGMSIATLKRRLAAENLSFSHILKVKRVNHAATKLRLTSKSIAQVAAESGFKSAAHFSTAFKHVQGMSPREFRLTYK